MIRHELFGATLVMVASDDADRGGVERLATVALQQRRSVNLFRSVGASTFLLARLYPGRDSVTVRRPGGTVQERDVASAVRCGLSRFTPAEMFA